ncbi:MAG: OmpA family protein [Gammaproteobacteria bacterium]
MRTLQYDIKIMVMEGSMGKGLLVLLGLIALAILGYFCIYQHKNDIQEDIHTRTVAAVTPEGLGDANVTAHGRDVTLTGEVASEEIKSQAEKLALDVYGVRTVDNQLVLVAPELEPEPETEIIEEPEVVEEPKAVAPPKLEPLPEYTCQQEFDFLLSSNEIHFATNSANIEASSNNLLNDLVDVAKQCLESKIEIGGHTDSRGSDDYNLRLSQERATSVMSYLVNKGIDPSQLSAIGYGESIPIADNETEEGLAKNRRIEFNVKGL